jgi:hypothetical protein
MLSCKRSLFGSTSGVFTVKVLAFVPRQYVNAGGMEAREEEAAGVNGQEAASVYRYTGTLLAEQIVMGKIGKDWE